MALRSVLDVALHFESFRNVDLFHQGLYHLKVRLYIEEDDDRLSAIPYGHLACPNLLEQPKPSSRVDHHNLKAAFVIEDDDSFCTRSYLIRYCEEEVEINEIAQFRLELTEEQMKQNAPLVLEVELMFADLSQHGGADRFGEHPDVSSTEFKSISTQLYRVHGFDQSIHEYCPVVFDEFHFCLANISIHTVLLDKRFRTRLPQQAKPKPADAKAKPVKPTDDAAKREAAMVQKPENLATQNGALSLSDCIFGNSRAAGQDELLHAAEVFYQEQMQLLSKSYTGLLTWYHDVVKKCLTEGQREGYGEAVEDPEEQLIGSDMLPPSQPFQSDIDHLIKGHNFAIRKHLMRQMKEETRADEDAFARLVARDINTASCQILGVWHRVMNLMLYCFREVTALLRRSWEQRMAIQWREQTITQEIGDDIMAPHSWLALHDVAHVHQPLDFLREPINGLRPVYVEDVALSSEMQPVIWEQKYAAQPNHACDVNRVPSEPKAYRGVHLWVFVHGFQGNSFDMRLFKNNLALVYPDAIFLTSVSNEENTDGDFHEMGIRLAQEVINFVCDWCPGTALGKLSFVGYSIGGIIIRAALPQLGQFYNKLYTYISLTSMHFGYLDSQTAAFNTVLYALGHWRKIKCIQQLSMSEAADPKDTFLYKLSKSKGLEYFQWICLLSSKQDNYSPVMSSGAAMNKAWENSNDKYKEAYREMCRNFWEPLDPRKVMRIGTHFHIAEKNLDSAIGRVAHIRFIENQPLMKMLIHNYSFLFR